MKCGFFRYLYLPSEVFVLNLALSVCECLCQPDYGQHALIDSHENWNQLIWYKGKIDKYTRIFIIFLFQNVDPLFCGSLLQLWSNSLTNSDEIWIISIFLLILIPSYFCFIKLFYLTKVKGNLCYLSINKQNLTEVATNQIYSCMFIRNTKIKKKFWDILQCTPTN